MNPTFEKPLYQYHIIDLIRIFFQFKRQIIAVTILALIGSIIVAMLLPVYYQSKTILYPNSLTLADKNSIFGQQQTQAEFSYYGNKYDASRTLSVANSSEIVDYIINKYNLIEHYGYNKQEQYIYTKVKKEFLENYAAFKNDKDAIEISLYDTDKNLCAQMVNDIVAKMDEMAIVPILESKKKIIKMLHIEYDKKQEAIDSLKSHGGSEKMISNYETELQLLSKSITEYNVSANDEMSSITILEKAYPAEKKSKPTRSVIVILSTLTAFFTSLLIAVFVVQYSFLVRELKK